MKKLFFLFFLFFVFTKTYGFSDLQKEMIDIKIILRESKSDYEERKETYKKYFQVLQSVDNNASINPYYFLKLKEKIHENEIYLKAFIYIFYEIKNNIKINKNYYSNYKEIIQKEMENPIYNYSLPFLEKSVFDYLKANKYNYLSKNDLERFKKEILKNKIGPDSKTFQYFIQYRNFLTQFQKNNISLKYVFIQKLQEKNLSCEINSASLFSTYLLGKNVSEQDIFTYIKQDNSKVKKEGKFYVWGNPDESFVGDISGKQTKIIEKMTGYGVHAKPISFALKQIGIQNKITHFNKDIIVTSLLKNEPVMFWYLSKTNSSPLNTTPLYWKTPDNKIIQGYIGEHTGVIVGITFFDNGKINEIQFYEGRNENLQILPFADMAYQASFFNMMITKE